MAKQIKCECCGKVLSMTDDVLETVDGGLICYECYSKKYTICGSCKKYFITDGHYMCKKCEDDIYNKSLNCYSTKPRPSFKNKYCTNNNDLNNIYYGLEMEFSYVSPTLIHRMLKKYYDDKYIYNKSDSSLCGGGVEIVTSPMDKYRLNKFLSDIHNDLKVINKVKNYNNNAGVHIHVSRKGIPKETIYKLSYLLNYKNSSVFKNIIYYLSNRCTFKNMDDCNDSYCKIGDTYSINDLKYVSSHDVALNLGNDNTIEFRLFKSTCDTNVIKMYVELVNKMIYYCNNNPIKRINIPLFIQWLYNNTDNKIIKDKIDRYNKKYNILLYTNDNIYTKDKYFKILKGIKWYNLLEYVDKLKRIKENKLLYIKDINNIPNTICKDSNDIYYDIENRLRKLYKNKIKKGEIICV